MSDFYGLRPDQQDRLVEGLNKANRAAREWHGKLSEIFAPFVGKKVMISGGLYLSKAANAAIDKVLSGVRADDPQRSLGGRHRLSFAVSRSWRYAGDDWRSARAGFVIGEINDDGVLVRLVPDDEERRFDRSGDEVRAAIAEARAAREAAHAAELVLAKLDR
jgi:hypothetical protein